MQRIENRTFDELKIGDSASLMHTLTYKDIQLFAAMSGDVNPAYVDPGFAKDDMFHKIMVKLAQRYQMRNRNCPQCLSWSGRIDCL